MYDIIYNKFVQKDFKKLGKSKSKKVHITIIKKLSYSPEEFGTYLRKDLFPYQKLRIGDIRVVYKILEEEKKGYILAIGERRDNEIYIKAMKRKST